MSKIALATVLVSACLAVAPVAAQAASFGSNLVTNGNAETGDTTGFTTTGAFETQAYNQGGFPGTGDPGASEGGNYLFAGGNSGFSSASQTIDLSSLAAAINLGTTSYDLSALIGGFSSQDDNGIVQISFLDATGGTLGSASIGPVLAADRENRTGLLSRSTTGAVPIGTLTANLLLTSTRTAGSYDDGYIDNVSLVLTQGVSGAVPEPASWAMMIGGIGIAGGAMRRRRGIGAVTPAIA